MASVTRLPTSSLLEPFRVPTACVDPVCIHDGTLVPVDSGSICGSDACSVADAMPVISPPSPAPLWHEDQTYEHERWNCGRDKNGTGSLSGGRQSPVNSTHQFCARNHRIGVAEAGEGDTGVAVRGNGGSHQHTILKPPLSHNSVQQLVASSNWAIETGRQPMDAALFSTARTVADGRSGERCTIQATTACAHDPPRTKYYRRPRGDS